MIPAVLVQNKAVAPTDVLEVHTFRDIGMPDYARISLKQPAGTLPYRSKQAVEVNLAPNGDQIFSGEIHEIEPAPKGKAIVLKCKSKGAPSIITVSPDPVMIDSFTSVTFFRPYLEEIKERHDTPSGEAFLDHLEMKIGKSKETLRLLYELNWFKITQFPVREGAFFEGRITSIERFYSPLEAPVVTLAMFAGKTKPAQRIVRPGHPIRHYSSGQSMKQAITY